MQYTVGLLYLFLGDVRKAEYYIKSAGNIYREKLGESHPSTVDVCAVAGELERDIAFMGQQAGLAESGGGDGGGAPGTSDTNGGGSRGGPMGISSGGVDQMEGFADLINQFPEDMPRAATQSPIPLPPGSRQSVG